MLKTSTFLLVMAGSLPLFAAPPVIYGEDNRREVYEASALEQKLAASTATMIARDKLTQGTEGRFNVEQTTMRQWLEAQFEEEKSPLLSQNAQALVDEKISFCAGEKFTEQPNAGMCSGFLIGPDLLVTAGHCVTVADFCPAYSWVFDFKVDEKSGQAGLDIPQENVFQCKKVISTALSNALGLDYALIQLDRKVNRPSLQVRSGDLVAPGAPLVVIGSPSGLPLKVSAGANVRENSHPFYFSANLDTFQGNSGSAVFNAETGVVEGILVRGEEDFEANGLLMCIEAKRCENDACRGEDISRMTSIPEIAVKDTLFHLAQRGDVKGLSQIVGRFWVDIYGNDGRTALMKAVENKKAPFVSALIARGADVKIQDAEGNTALHILAPILNRKSADVLKVLLNAGPELESKNDLSETAVLAAARNTNLESIRLLVRAGANIKAVNGKGETVLFSFARKGSTKALKELIGMGADANVVNNEGQTIKDLRKPIEAVSLKK